MSAALDAVKESVEVPWKASKAAPEATSSTVTAAADATSAVQSSAQTSETPAATDAPADAPALNSSEESAATPPETAAPATAETSGSSMAPAAAAAAESAAAQGSSAEPTPSQAPAEASTPSATSGMKAETELKSSPSVPEFSADETPVPPRSLHWRHFATALKETTPSSSEALGTLADLRKWNDEFGEGQRDKKHKTVWGKGKFGFIPKPVGTEADGRVVDPNPSGKKAVVDTDARR